jgi:hypothetical protein
MQEAVDPVELLSRIESFPINRNSVSLGPSDLSFMDDTSLAANVFL